MSIKKSSKSNRVTHNFDINFRSIPSGANNNVSRGNREKSVKLFPTTKLVGYTKEGAPIYEAVKTQNNITVNHIHSGSTTKRSAKTHSMKRRIIMG